MINHTRCDAWKTPRWTDCNSCYSNQATPILPLSERMTDCSWPTRPKLKGSYISNCIRMSSPKRHSSSLAVLSSGVCISSSSLLRLKLLLVLVAIVGAVVSLSPLLRLLFFLNQPRLIFVFSVSASERLFSELSASASVLSVLAIALTAKLAMVLGFELTLVKALDAVEVERECAGLLEEGVGVVGSAASAIGSRRGVGTGVTSVEGVTSTSSASRYHFRRRV